MANKLIKLSELPHGSNIEIGGHIYKFTGFEKRKTNFGKQEHFVFECEKPKHEKIFERFTFSTTKIKENNGEYKW